MIKIYSKVLITSVADGPGVRFVLYLQGCGNNCDGCHNPETWNVEEGLLISVNKLSKIIRQDCINKKLTISGGEPLLQKYSLLKLLKKLKNYNIALYTSAEIENIDHEILSYLKYVKTGKYEKQNRSTTSPYIGSTNQKFITLR